MIPSMEHLKKFQDWLNECHFHEMWKVKPEDPEEEDPEEEENSSDPEDEEE